MESQAAAELSDVWARYPSSRSYVLMGAELLLERQAVHLDHHAIDVVGELAPHVAQFPVKRQNLANCYLGSDKGIDGKPPDF